MTRLDCKKVGTLAPYPDPLSQATEKVMVQFDLAREEDA